MRLKEFHIVVGQTADNLYCVVGTIVVKEGGVVVSHSLLPQYPNAGSLDEAIHEVLTDIIGKSEITPA